MPSRLLEADLARTCTELLQLDGWRALKTEPVSRREWGKGFGEKGMADYLYIRYADPGHSGCDLLADVLWIEWKTPRGKVSDLQRQWRERERARGARALIAGVDFHASIEGFARWYAQSGLQMKKLRIGAAK